MKIGYSPTQVTRELALINLYPQQNICRIYQSPTTQLIAQLPIVHLLPQTITMKILIIITYLEKQKSETLLSFTIK